MRNLTDSDSPPPTDRSHATWRDWAESLVAPADLSIDVTSIRPGRTEIVARGSAWPKNPNGALHGGMVTAAITHCATIAAAVTISSGSPVRPSALAVTFLRPAIPPLTLEADVHETGPVAIFATVTVTAQDGRICSSAQVTLCPDESSTDPEPGSRTRITESAPNSLGMTANFLPAPVDGDESDWKSWADELPVSRAMGAQCLALSPTLATFLMKENQLGSEADEPVPEGTIAAWADHCFGLIATAAVRPGASPATAALSMQFLAPAAPPLTFHATVEKSGRTLAFVSVNVRDTNGQLVSIAKGTMSVDGTSRFLPATN